MSAKHHASSSGGGGSGNGSKASKERDQAAATALALFERAQYQEALVALTRVPEMPGGNAKDDLHVQHNIEVCRYHAAVHGDASSSSSSSGGAASTTAVALGRVLERIQALGSSFEQQQQQQQQQQGGANAMSVALLRYNLCTLLYLQHQFRSAAVQLERLLEMFAGVSLGNTTTATGVSPAISRESSGGAGGSSSSGTAAAAAAAAALAFVGSIATSHFSSEHISAPDELLFYHTAMLLLDTYVALGLQQVASAYDRAMAVIQALERTFAALLKRQSAEAKKSSTSGTTATAANSNSNAAVSSGSAPSLTLSLIPATSLHRHAPVSATELRFSLHEYRAKINFLARQPKPSKKEIKFAMSVGNKHPTSIFLKSNFEYHRTNHAKAIRILNAASETSTDPALAQFFFNDMGCIHFRLGKYNAAAFYFAEAVRLSGEGGLESKTRQHELLYNSGIAQLVAGNAESAFDCFFHAAQLYYNSPRLWLRLAECIVAVHSTKTQSKRSTSTTWSTNSTSSSSSASVAADSTATSSASADAGHHEGSSSSLPSPSSKPMLAFLLPTSPHRTPFLRHVPPAKSSSEAAEESYMSIEFGLMCLRNCLFLCNTQASDATNVEAMRQSALINMAYLALAADDPLLVISCTKQLFATKNLIRCYGFLAHIYIAEAFCLLNRPAEGLRHLSPALLNEESALVASPGTIASPYSYNYAEVSRYSLFHNLVVSHLLCDDIAQAQQCLSKAAITCPQFCEYPFLLLQIYLEIRKGNLPKALELFRRGRGV